MSSALEVLVYQRPKVAPIDRVSERTLLLEIGNNSLEPIFAQLCTDYDAAIHGCQYKSPMASLIVVYVDVRDDASLRSTSRMLDLSNKIILLTG